MQVHILFTASPSSEETDKNIRQLCREFGLETGKTLSGRTSSCLAREAHSNAQIEFSALREAAASYQIDAVSYTHLRAHETGAYLVCRLLLEKKK